MNEKAVTQLAAKIMEITTRELNNYFMITFGKVPPNDIVKKHGVKQVQGNVAEYTWKNQPMIRVKTVTELDEMEIVKCTITVKRDFVDGGEKEHEYVLTPTTIANFATNPDESPPPLQ